MRTSANVDSTEEACYTPRMRYTVVINKTAHGFDVHCPALPGCHSQSETEKEALMNIKDAIKTYLAMVRKETKGLRTRRVLIPS